jgi:hypothetical protein
VANAGPQKFKRRIFVGILWSLALYIYNTDNGTPYNAAISTVNAAADSWTASPPGSLSSLPRGLKMRHVLGKNSTGARHKLECDAINDSIFVVGNSFNLVYIGGGGGSYTVQGRIGELRALKI